MVKSWQEVVDINDELPEEVQRWTAKRRSALILSIIKHWREKFLAAAENALRTKPRDEEARKDEQIKKLKQKVGELVRRRGDPQGGPEGTPFRLGDVRRVREVFPHLSERRVCRLLEVPRSAMNDRCSTHRGNRPSTTSSPRGSRSSSGSTPPSATAASGRCCASGTACW